jgi:glycosyltransferase involved in cell wall biosynthesis
MLGESHVPMRVLLLHNRYRAEGGEERAVAAIQELLVQHGHEVALLERSSSELGSLHAAEALIRGGIDEHDVRHAVTEMKADIVHAHNLHPAFGYRALEAARAAGARTVFQLHNFRLYCAIGIAYRDGRPCHDCKRRNTLPGLVHRCRVSVPEAAVYAAGLSKQQRKLIDGTDRFIVLSDAHGVLLREHGLPSDRADTLPNFISTFAHASRAHEGSYALVAGRLVPEKGFDTAIRAANEAGVPLVVAGAGPDESRLRALAFGSDVRFTGWLDREALARMRAGAGVVLVPSRCEEACPYAVLDALADGVPVLASDRGGLPELVVTQTLPADDPRAWARALEAFWNEGPSHRHVLGQRTLADARARFGAQRYLERLLAVYARALNA